MTDTVSKTREQIGEALAGARTSIEQSIAELDAQIRKKTQELDHLQAHSISAPLAAKAVAGNIHATLRTHRAELVRRAAKAAHLATHAATFRYGAVDGAGRTIRVERDREPLSILPYDLNALDLAAIALTDPQIEAFAKDAIGTTDAPATGPGVDEIAAAAARLDEDLQQLHADRFALREQLAGFLEMSTSPLVPDEFFRVHRSTEGAPTGAAPRVTTAGGGPMVSYAAPPHEPLHDDDAEVVTVPGISVAVPSADSQAMNPPLGPERLAARTAPAPARQPGDFTPAEAQKILRAFGS